jgi:hypothetical protein
VVGINRRKILRTPRPRIKSRKHQQWIKTFHVVIQANKLRTNKKDRSPAERPLPNPIIAAPMRA